MRYAKLLHNPGAGDGEHSMKDLAEIIKSAGFECSYSSTKAWPKPTIKPDELDFLVLAGGDGTVRKIAKELLDENLPIGLLPMGTANNIAKTLGLCGEIDQIIHSWKKRNIKSFDVGRIHGLPKDKFFLEGFGFGVFPVLMVEMEKQGKESIEDPALKLKAAVELLHEIVQSFEAVDCIIKIDGQDHSGKYLLAEVMNIRSIGPNLILAPGADPGDGKFDVVLIHEEERDQFANYLAAKINGNEIETSFKTIQSRTIEIEWQGTTSHIDDEMITIDAQLPLSIALEKNALQFLVPDQDQMPL
jgi:diacylglycerol kinase family enzyme